MANSNGRRKLRRQLQKAGLGEMLETLRQKPATKPPWTFSRVFGLIPTWVRWFLSVFGVAVALVQLRPSLNLQKDESLSPNNPYRTMFVVANDGYIPITNIVVTCLSNSGGNKFKISNSGMTIPIEGTFGHNRHFTLPCTNLINGTPDSLDAFKLPRGSKFDQAELTVYIHYSFLGAFNHSEKFLLKAEPADNGSLHWAYSK
jgi:hypothetical protein